MNKTEKSHLRSELIRWTAILTIIGLVTGLLLKSFFTSADIAFLAGILITTCFAVILLRFYLEKSILDVRDKFESIVTVEKADLIRNYKNLATLLKLHELYKEEWTREILEDIISFKKNLKRFEKSLYELEVTNSFGEVRKMFYKEKEFEDAKAEIVRKNMLRRVIENAEKEILAVSYDINDYVETFFDLKSDFLSLYMQANIGAANRKVNVKRIFVVEDSMYLSLINIPQKQWNPKLFRNVKQLLQPPNNPKNKSEYNLEVLKRVIGMHLLADPDFMEVRICSMSKARQVPQESFLVCDGYICSDAKKDVETNLLTGSLSLRDQKKINRLEENFDYLEGASYKIEPYL